MPANTQIIIDLIQRLQKQMENRVCLSHPAVGELTINQIKVLKNVYFNHKMSMADIAAKLGITPASTTNLVDRLVKNGWLKRESDENDRRKIYVIITDDKRDKFAECMNKSVQCFQEYLNILDDPEKVMFIKILQKLTNKES